MRALFGHLEKLKRLCNDACIVISITWDRALEIIFVASRLKCRDGRRIRRLLLLGKCFIWKCILAHMLCMTVWNFYEKQYVNNTSDKSYSISYFLAYAKLHGCAKIFALKTIIVQYIHSILQGNQCLNFIPCTFMCIISIFLNHFWIRTVAFSSENIHTHTHTNTKEIRLFFFFFECKETCSY